MFFKKKEKKKKPPFWSVKNWTEMAGMLLLVFAIRTFIFGLYQVPSGSMEPTMLIGERFFADKLVYWLSDPVHNDIIATNAPESLFDYSDNTLMRLFQDYVWGPPNFTKRIIGVPGDTIEGKIEDGKAVVYRNGQKLHEPYINPYPLLAVFKVDPSGLMQHMTGRNLDDFWKNITFFTVDPKKDYQDQPFYRIDPRKVVTDPEGSPVMQWPGQVREPNKPQSETDGKKKNHWDGSDVFYVELGPDEYWGMGDNRLGSMDSRSFGPIKRSFIHGKIRFRIWSHDSDENWFIVDMLKNPIDFWKRMRWSRFFQLVK